MLRVKEHPQMFIEMQKATHKNFQRQTMQLHGNAAANIKQHL
jgi:hypothetical protein